MKKFLILFIATISMSVFVGCDSDDDFNPPNFVTFADVTTLTNQRSVSVSSEGSETVDVKVYTNNVTNADRTFNITVGATSTLSAAAYTLPATVTIPANSNEGIVSINITGSGVNNAGDILMLQLENADGYVGGPLRINVLKVCPFDASQWYGTYDVSEVFVAGDNTGLSLAAAFGESYQVEMVTNPANATGSVILRNSAGFDQFFVNGTVLTFGACAGNVIISNPNIAAGFANLTVTSSSFNAETKTVTVTGTLGGFGTYRYILTRQE
ncbi:MAG: hypothetical protein ACQEWG_16035 [Bacteroidota bacterium]